MPFIGNKPSAVPLTSADITDGIIVNADINASAGITLNKLSGNPSFRNIVINGDMSIAQRSTSVASITVGGYYTVDRFQTFINGTLGTWTQSQSTDTPTGQGFAKSLKMDCTTADASPASADFLIIQQSFEGQNLQYLKKGTANAVSLTASFWVKSTKTGTFICELLDTDNTRAVSGTYTVITTNTWEKKTVTFPADATGAFTNDNGESLRLNFWLGAGTDFTSGTLATTWASTTSANRAVGQVNIADSTSNDWYITGVQLEAGTSATDFEFLPIDVNLGRCQRYYRQCINNIGVASLTTGWTGSVEHLSMRATPSYSVTLANTSITDFYSTNPVASGTTLTINANTNSYGNINATGFTGLTVGRLYSVQPGNSPIFASAEL